MKIDDGAAFCAAAVVGHGFGWSRVINRRRLHMFVEWTAKLHLSKRRATHQLLARVEAPGLSSIHVGPMVALRPPRRTRSGGASTAARALPNRAISWELLTGPKFGDRIRRS